MSLSITRQNQLLEIFDTLVEKAIESLGYRKAAMEVLKSRPAYKVWVEVSDASAKHIAAMIAETEKHQKDMDKLRAAFEKATGGKVEFHEFMTFQNFTEVVKYPDIVEKNGEIHLRTDDIVDRSARFEPDRQIIDRERIGPPEFNEFVESLRADLKLSLTERELVAALSKAKEEIVKYIKEHKT